MNARTIRGPKIENFNCTEEFGLRGTLIGERESDQKRRAENLQGLSRKQSFSRRMTFRASSFRDFFQFGELRIIIRVLVKNLNF